MRWQACAAWGVCLGASVLFLYIQLFYGLSPLPGDEVIYLKGGALLLDGKLPYRDFFLAHPPLRTFIAAVAAALPYGGQAAKLLCVVASLGTALMTGLLVRRTAGDAAGAVAGCLYLLCDHSLSYASFFVGINLTVFFVVAGVLAARHGRFACAGVLHAVALNVALYAALPVLAFGVCLAVERKPMRRYLAGLSAVAAAYLAYLAAFGWEFVEQVLLYHLHKKHMPGFKSSGTVFVTFFERAYALLLLPLVLLASHEGRRLAALAAIGWAIILAISFYSSTHDYYYLLGLPFLAAGGGAGTVLFLRFARASAGRWLTVVALVGLIAGGAMFFHEALGRSFSLARVRADFVAQESGPLMAPFLEEAATDDPIFGDSSLAPLFSLETGNPVAGDILDTNPKRFHSGAISPTEMIGKAEAAGTRWLLFIDHHGLYTVPEIRAWTRNKFKLHYRYHVKSLAFVVLVYSRR